MKLEDAAKSIADGNLNNKIEPDSNDEFGSLTSSFEKMRFDLKTLQDRLIDQIKKLEAANNRFQEVDQQKTHFFQSISHELRTPLTLIMNPLETAAKTYPEDQGLKIAAANSKRLFRLVTQLLDFQKLSIAKSELKLRPIRVPDFLQACAASFTHTCSTLNVRFFLNIRSHYDPIIL
ncbi:MAG: HAMP domain-containing protein, partial [Oligoflexales bacterium]|nr:HAMP domain-containing protein [Oligoflexales bacterium]